MRSTLLLVHLCLAAAWIGCVFTEVLFERALLAGDRAQHRVLARLHARVDLWVETPAFLGVLATGVLMMAQARPAWPGFHLKLALGLLAIVANAWCVRIVLLRRQAAEAGDWARFDRLDHAQHKLGAVVLLAALGALAVGGWAFASAA